MAIEDTNYYLSGGKLYFTSETAGAQEEEIGDITDAAVSVETETAEALSRSYGASEIVAESVIKRDYTLTFTSSNISTANLARFFYGLVRQKTYVGGDVYLNGETLSDFDSGDSYAQGDYVIKSGSIYRALDAISAGAFDETEWEKVGSTSTRITSANRVNKVTGAIRIEGAPVDGRKATWKIYKVNLKPSGDFKLIGGEYSQLVFEGAIQRVGENVFDVYEDQ
jgi:hypothetical protein